MADEAADEVPSLRRLTSLPWDEKTENGMLRSRLDEQSQLICMLKRRADETLLKCQDLETGNQELERRRGEAEGRLQAESQRGNQLEERFELLAANHQQMICFKDEYKRQNVELRGECEQLREWSRANTQPELLERDRRIRELQAQLGAADTEQREQRSRQEEELETLRRSHEQILEKSRGQSLELESLTRKLQDSEEMCRQAQKNLSRLQDERRVSECEAVRMVKEAKKEKQELLQLCMERGRIIQEHQREASELGDRILEAEKACREAEERYQRDSAAVDTDARVADLRKRVEEGEEELGQLNREFEAYRTHSRDLLAKERNLNAKLRHLIG
ncbi:coiled-coil domain-containing protein 89 [Ascaphus truei]|uniref:coiled-coil domain-containing protein 89 n=1 Tax=Ascaphus truei TaxID=8439 RepID=UPI003F598EA7